MAHQQAYDRDAVIEEHLPLVDHLVHQVAARFPRHVDRDELRGAAMAGLVDAARRYDPSSGVPFARYASIRMRGEILDAARSRDWATRRLRRDLRSIESATDQLEHQLGRAPTDADVATATGLSEEQVRERRDAQITVTLLALDRPSTSFGDDGEVLADRIAEEDASWLPEIAVERGELVELLRAAVEALPADLREVLVGHHFDGRRLRDIAVELGLTEARVSQLRFEALHAVQAYFATQFEDVEDVGDAPGKRRRVAYVAQMRAQESLRRQADERARRTYDRVAASTA